MVKGLKVLMIVVTIGYSIYMYRDIFAHKAEDTEAGKWKGGRLFLYAVMGCILNLLDTLGVGSNATQAAFFKFTKLSPDEELPANGNVIFAVPVAFEFILFLGLIELDLLTLVSMMVAAVAGAVVGARFMAKASVRTVRTVLAIVLPIVAVILVCKLNGFGPFGLMGNETGLTGGKLIIGIVVNFALGVLMTCGVGLYAPCMALCALLGLNITVAFPIMMGSCAFLMPPASIEFIKQGRYNRPAAAVATITGLAGVAIAYWIVKSMPIKILTYIVAVVLVYMSISFVLSIRKSGQES